MRKKLTIIKFYTKFYIGLFFYFPFFLIFYFFKKKNEKKILFFLTKYRKYIGFNNNQLNTEDENIFDAFNENVKIKSEIYYIDTKRSKLHIFENIKAIFNIFIKSPEYIFAYSDFDKDRYHINISIIYLISKLKLSKVISISADSVWLINILRTNVIKNSNQVIYYGDRNILIINNQKKRLCPTNISNIFLKNTNKPMTEREIDVLFIGRIKNLPDREKNLKYLKDRINIMIFDTDKKFFDTKTYKSYLQNTKILINFNKSPNDRVHFVGRSLEAIACGCLLLEPQINYLKRDFMKQSLDFVEYKGMNDLIEKVNYYLSNIEMMKKISISGNSSLIHLYQEKNLWKYIFDTKKF